MMFNLPQPFVSGGALVNVRRGPMCGLIKPSAIPVELFDNPPYPEAVSLGGLEVEALYDSNI
jgi:hypothetical protein